jgi:hypothetical protein
MARTKKVQNEFNESNELEPIEVQVIDNSVKAAISPSEDESNHTQRFLDVEVWGL